MKLGHGVFQEGTVFDGMRVLVNNPANLTVSIVNACLIDLNELGFNRFQDTKRAIFLQFLEVVSKNS